MQYRKARLDEVQEVAQVCADAFEDYPYLSMIASNLKKPEQYKEFVLALQEILVRLAIKQDSCLVAEKDGRIVAAPCNGTGDTAFRNLHVRGMWNQQTVRWSGVKASGSVRCSRDSLRNLICTCSGNFTAAPVDHRITWNEPVIDKTKSFRKRRMNHG